MKAVVVAKYGSPDGLQFKEVEKPIPKDNEVLIKIHVATVTFGDAMLRSFTFPIRLIFLRTSFLVIAATFLIRIIPLLSQSITSLRMNQHLFNSNCVCPMPISRR